MKTIISPLFTRPLFLTLDLLLLAICLPACVSLEGMPGVPGMPTSAPLAFQDLDSGSTSTTSTHFTIKGYNDQDMQAISRSAEDLYNKIGNDTGLYSFMSGCNFTIVIYKDREEYMAKTHQPATSYAVWASSGIYLYPSPDVEPAMAFEITRMVLNNYLGDKSAPNRWLIEGLAMFEEAARMPESDRSAFQSSQLTQLRAGKMPFSQMTFFVPNNTDHRRTDVWYQQVESVAGYLLNQGSPLTFAAMMSELRGGNDIDRAISDSYPGRFRSMIELETAWKATT
ncbi:MAG TPA: hypothetical protein VMU17_03565 [Elusimicrobiota bacterium]|nr:hypothetical protein [Elusimicrobiota bacterium]